MTMMGMGMGLQLLVAIKCKACGQLVRDQAERIAMMNVAAVFGQVFYAVCWACHQEVPTSLRTPRYRRAWLKALVEKAAKAQDERVLWAFAHLLKTGAGYTPNARCFYRRKPFEFISYPFVENGRVVVYVREVEKPWTLQKDIPIEKAIPRSKKATAVLQGLLG